MRRQLAILVVTALAVSVAWAGPARAGTFDDVPEGVWFEAPVEWLVSAGITNGTSATTFSPGAFVSRAQMAAFLARFGESVGDSPEAGFADVPGGVFYDAPVDWLLERGITQGTSATTYSPGANVTRAQMAAFLWRFAGRPPSSFATPFVDVPAGSWYAEAVSWLLENDITQGTSATTFSPGANVTRAQMAAFLWRLAGEPAVGDSGSNRVASLPISSSGGEFVEGDVSVTVDGLTDDGFVKVVVGEGGAALASLDGAVSDDVEISVSQAEVDGPITVTVPIETVDLDDVELIVYVLDENGQWQALAIDVATKVVDGQMFATFTLPAGVSLAPSALGGFSLFAAGDFERIVARVATRDLPPPSTTSTTTSTTTSSTTSTSTTTSTTTTSTTTTSTTTTVAPDPLTIDVSALPTFATEGSVVTGAGLPTADGGTGGYTFSSPDLPAGLSMAADGAITGTPTVDGRFYITVEVEDSNSSTTSTIHVLDIAAIDQEGRFDVDSDVVGSFNYPSVSPDGRYIAVDAGDDLDGDDIVEVLDRDTDTVVATIKANGFGRDGVVFLSDDGRYATYRLGTSLRQLDIDTATVTEIAADLGHNYNLYASRDGSAVVFQSSGGDLETPTDPLADAAGYYLWDRTDGSYERIAASLGTPVVAPLAMDGDGSVVAAAQNMAIYPAVAPSDGYLWDPDTDAATAIADTAQVALSADGSVVAFVPDGDPAGGLTVWDRDAATTTVVLPPGSFVQRMLVSDDGAYITFVTFSEGLVSGDANGANDVYQYDVAADEITRVTSGEGVLYSYYDVSGDGSVVAFVSADPDITAGDDLNDDGASFWQRLDVFIWRRDSDTYERVTRSAIPASFTPVGISRDGSLVWFYRLPTAAPGLAELHVWDRGSVYD